MGGRGRRRCWGLALLAVALIGCGGADPQRVEPAADDGTWRKLPRAPGAKRAGLQELTAHKVGSTVVVIAGANYNQRPVGGLRYDLDARRWRTLRPSPLLWRVDYAAAVVRDEIVVWGGATAGVHSDGARYDVHSDTWRRLSASPLGARYLHSAVSTGDEVIFFGGSRNSGGSRSGAVYTPAADSWRRIPPAPIAGRRDPVAVWTGREMIVWGGYARERTEPSGFFADGAAFDPTAGEWSRIADGPVRAGEHGFGLWAGDRLFVFNGSRAALYDPASDQWRLTAEPPLPGGVYEGAWTGERVLVLGTRMRRGGVVHGAAYEPATDAWTPLPRAPLRARGRHAALWTGDSLFVWGGCCRGGGVHADGAEYRPATGR